VAEQFSVKHAVVKLEIEPKFGIGKFRSMVEELKQLQAFVPVYNKVMSYHRPHVDLTEEINLEILGVSSRAAEITGNIYRYYLHDRVLEGRLLVATLAHTRELCLSGREVFAQ
jgi:hypothetical protein